MANKYLLSSEPSGGTIQYFTANATGDLVPIGGTYDMSKGFTDDILILLNNDDYKTLENGKLWIDSPTNEYTMNISSLDKGYLISTDDTNIDLQGYSGINGLTINGTGGKYAISFDKRQTWKSWGVVSTETLGDIVPKLPAAGYKITGNDVSYGSLISFFNDAPSGYAVGWHLVTSNLAITVELPEAKIISGYTFFSVPLDYCNAAPKDWRIFGSNDNINFDILDTRINVSDWIMNKAEKKTFLLENVGKAYKFYKIAFDGSNYSNALYLQQIELLGAKLTYGWNTFTSVDDIHTKGMSKDTIEKLVFNDFSPIFQRTQMDFLIGVSGSDAIESFVASLPPNAAPVIKNFSAIPDTMHKGNIDFSFDCIDAEGEVPKYRVLFNKKEVTPFTEVTGTTVNVSLKDELFTLGLNEIIIEAVDPRGATSKNTVYITRIDEAPTFTGVLNGNVYNLTIGDKENDKIKYRILFNGVEVVPMTSLLPTPYNFTYTIDKRTIKIGEQNILRVEAEDEYGVKGFVEETFIGTYYGILFSDTKDHSYYSTDLGDVLKRMSLGSLVANQTSKSSKIDVINKTNDGLKGVIVTVGTVPGTDIVAQVSADDTTFYSEDPIDLGIFTQNQIKNFYVRVKTNKTSRGGGDFIINVVGESI